MKKLLALLIIGVFMFAAPAANADWYEDMKTNSEEFGHNSFMYLKGVTMYPLHMLESGVRTLLFMDKE